MLIGSRPSPGVTLKNTSYDKPFLVGKPNGMEAVYVRAEATVSRFRYGHEAWVTGTRAAELIRDGLLVPLDVEPPEEYTPPPAPVANRVDVPDPPPLDADSTIAEVQAYVRAYPQTRESVTEAERKSKHRTTLIAWLESGDD